MRNSSKGLLSNESGQSVVFLAVLMGVFALGFLAIAIDAGSLFRQRRMAQSAADAASMAAAKEVSMGYTDQQSVANQVAAANGFDTTLASNPASVVLSTPTSGSFTGPYYVQATVSKPIHNIFLGALNPSLAYMTVSAQAIAGGNNNSPTCVCLTGSSGEDLLIDNDSSLSATNCGVVVNSNSSKAVVMNGSATLSAVSLGTVSTTWDNSQNINGGASISNTTKVVLGITTGCSTTVPPAPTYSNCLADPGGSYGTFTFGPSTVGGTICYTALTIGANGSQVTLNPGIYVISNGVLHFESGSGGHSNLGGDGVFFYLLNNSSLKIDNGANVNLVAGGAAEPLGGTAPSTGTYNGILFYQPASNTSAMNIAGGASAYIGGEVIAPGANLTLNNGTGSTIYLGVTAQTMTMGGGATLNAVSYPNEGSLSISSPRLVQ